MSGLHLRWLGFLLVLVPGSYFLPINHNALAKVVYVDKSATGDGSGTDWQNACTTITAGLTLSASGDQVWVKSATYEEAITMVQGVGLYGGFPNDGSPEFADRHWVVNETVIEAPGLNTRVVVAANSAGLDGFRVTGGGGAGGGGIYCYETSPEIRNCTITGNTGKDGGGFLISYGSPTIANCVIEENEATSSGGGIYCYQSSPVLTECVIRRNNGQEGGGFAMIRSTAGLVNCQILSNTAAGGGGVYCERSSPELVGCVVARNWASEWAGGISALDDSVLEMLDCVIAENTAVSAAGGIYLRESPAKIAKTQIVRNEARTAGGLYLSSCNPEITHCLIARNRAEPENSSEYSEGGAVFCISSSPQFVHCTFAWNTAGRYTGGIVCKSSAPMVTNSILWDVGEEFGGKDRDLATVTYSCIQGGWPGERNIEVPPGFLSPSTDDWSLANGSPCIDAGDDVGLPYNGPAPDMGAYESPPDFVPGPRTDTPRVLYVSGDAAPGGDGSDWEHAFSTISSALEIASTSDEIWVAAGTYTEKVSMEPAVAIYGGFSGSEENREGRNSSLLVTTIDVSGFDTSAVIGADQALLDGFHVTGGSSSKGGGVYCERASLILQDCVITENSGSTSGGGIYCSFCGVSFVNCEITNNDGGGLYLFHSTFALTNCRIADNVSGWTAGGLGISADYINSTPLEGRLAGCVISGNRADYLGGGAFIDRYYDSVVFADCEITGNRSQGHGGGLYVERTNPARGAQFTDCVISNNSSDTGGGGLSVSGKGTSTGHTQFTGCRISGNSSQGNGGGVSLYSSGSAVVFVNCEITANRTDANGGGLQINPVGSEPVLLQCAITENYAAKSGGGLSCESLSAPTLTNCVIAQNLADGEGSGIRCAPGAAPKVRNCVLWNRAQEIADPGQGLQMIHSCIRGGWTGEGNIDAYPLFVDPSSGDFRLLNGSPCIDAGIDVGLSYNGLAPDIGLWESPADYEPGNGEHTPHVIHVRADVPMGGDGLSWDSAFSLVEVGLFAAAPGDEVYVKQGVYPEAIWIGPGQRIYGGFEGNETHFSARGPAQNPTVIDASGLATTTVTVHRTVTIDGLTVTGGRDRWGGGLHCRRGSSMTLRDCTVTDNLAESDGGGIFLDTNSHLTAEKCFVTGNSSRSGGGIFLDGNCHLTAKKCFVTGNSSEYGGGIYARESSLEIEHCLIADSTATLDGGGVCSDRRSSISIAASCVTGNTAGGNGGGIRCANGSSLRASNCHITDNIAYGEGAAAHCGRSGSAQFVNCTIFGNKLAKATGGLCAGFVIQVTNCVLWNQGLEIGGTDPDFYPLRYCCIQGGWPGEGNIDAWPLLERVSQGTYQLLNGSPCIDAGTDVGLPYNGFAPDIGAWESPADYQPGDPHHVPRVLCVASDGPQSGDGSDWKHPLSSITAALEVASTSDEVWVKGGSYPESVPGEPTVSLFGGFAGYEDQLTQRDWVLNPTVVDATGLGRTVVVAPDRSTLDGFTITGGSGDVGGGVYCVDYASPTIRNCTITENYAYYEGGGLFSRYGSPTVAGCSIAGNSVQRMGGGMCLRETSFATITNCTFDGNSADAGGGIALVGGVSPILDGCTLTRNRTDSYGGGIHCYNECRPVFVRCVVFGNTAGRVGGGFMADELWRPLTLRNCLIVGNAAGSRAGGIGSYRSYPELTNCAIVGNSAPWGAAVFSGWNSHVRAANCIVRPGGLATYVRSSILVSWSNVEGGWPGEGNIDEPPAFVYPWDGYWADLHLLPTSPCIDAGNPDPPYNDACRPPGLGTERNDMGAYGGPNNCGGPPPLLTPESDWTPQPTPTYTVTPTPSSTPTETPTATITPTFSPTAPPTHTATASITPTSPPTSTPTPHPGDLTGDGLVDADDLFFFSKSWQEPANETNYLCDPTQDSKIDQNDLLWLIEKWREIP